MTTLVIIFLSSVATVLATLSALWWRLHGHLRRFDGDVNHPWQEFGPEQEQIGKT